MTSRMKTNKQENRKTEKQQKHTPSPPKKNMGEYGRI